MVINLNKIKYKLPRILLIILVLIVCIYLILRFVIYPINYKNIIQNAAIANSIDSDLIFAIIRTESNFNKYTISNKEAKGLMQIMDSTAKEIDKGKFDVNENNIFDETINIAIGSKYLASLIKKYNGNYKLAIIAYNAGMGNVDSWIEEGIIDKDIDENNNNIPFEETKKYLKKVCNSYKMYKILN